MNNLFKLVCKEPFLCIESLLEYYQEDETRLYRTRDFEALRILYGPGEHEYNNFYLLNSIKKILKDGIDVDEEYNDLIGYSNEFIIDRFECLITEFFCDRKYENTKDLVKLKQSIINNECDVIKTLFEITQDRNKVCILLDSRIRQIFYDNVKAGTDSFFGRLCIFAESFEEFPKELPSEQKALLFIIHCYEDFRRWSFMDLS